MADAPVCGAEVVTGPPGPMQDVAKHSVDAVALTVAGMSWLQILPHIAAVLSIIWFLIRIYESDTVQKMLGKRRGE